jgi:hypothetical protein
VGSELFWNLEVQLNIKLLLWGHTVLLALAMNLGLSLDQLVDVLLEVKVRIYPLLDVALNFQELLVKLELVLV